MFSVDTFVQGAKEPCEDYVLAGVSPVPHVLLSDGCSSEPQTDVGARLLAHAYLKRLTEGDRENASIRAVTNALTCANILGLSHAALHATLSVLHVDDDNVWARLHGDGVVFYRLKGDKAFRWFQVEYEGNMPFYPLYHCDRAVLRHFAEKTRRIITGNGYQDAASLFESVGETVCLLPTFLVDTVGIASDGLASFGVPVETVLSDLCDFKGHGKRLQRRMRRLLKDYAKRGLTHTDDLSVGVLFREEEADASASDVPVHLNTSEEGAKP